MTVVPYWALQGAGISRAHANQIGIVGCSIQLTDDAEYDYTSLTFTLRPQEALYCFLTIERIPFDYIPEKSQGYVRMDVTHTIEYLRYFTSIEEFLNRWRDLRAVRLGSRSLLKPWELCSHDYHMIMMDESEFLRHFIPDPRGKLTHAEILRGLTLHKPLMRGNGPLEFQSPPQESGWIRSCSTATKWTPTPS